MSSTNRGGERNASDYYRTPAWSIRQFLAAFSDDRHVLCTGVNPFVNPVTVLDPCAGGDARNEMAYPAAIEKWSQWHRPIITTCDIREDSRAEWKGDYLTTKYGPVGGTPFDIAITNPPFNLAMPIIQKCLNEVVSGGFVIMLLRLNYFGAQSRASWFRDNMPVACYVHSKRLGFTDDGKTDSIEYMHAVWQVGNHPKFTQLRILPAP